MAKRRSDKSTFPSRYDGGHVTIAQYITEYLCENLARSMGKDLPPKFWELEEWAKFFRAQIVLLNRQILTTYHPRAVVYALKDYRCKKVSSFGGFLKVQRWKDVLIECDKRAMAEDALAAKAPVNTAVDATKVKPKAKPGKKHVLSKLRDIDNGKEEGESRDRDNSITTDPNPIF